MEKDHTLEQISAISKIIKQINEEEIEIKKSMQEENNNKIEKEIGKIRYNNMMKFNSSKGI